jgi:hypothetical protein
MRWNLLPGLCVSAMPAHAADTLLAEINYRGDTGTYPVPLGITAFMSFHNGSVMTATWFDLYTGNNIGQTFDAPSDFINNLADALSRPAPELYMNHTIGFTDHNPMEHLPFDPSAAPLHTSDADLTLNFLHPHIVRWQVTRVTRTIDAMHIGSNYFDGTATETIRFYGIVPEPTPLALTCTSLGTILVAARRRPRTCVSM